MSTATLYVEPGMSIERAIDVVDQALARDSHFSVYSQDSDRVEVMKPLRQAVVMMRFQPLEFAKHQCPELARALALLKTFNEQWTAQDGINASALDQLSDACDELEKAGTS